MKNYTIYQFLTKTIQTSEGELKTIEDVANVFDSCNREKVADWLGVNVKKVNRYTISAEDLEKGDGLPYSEILQAHGVQHREDKRDGAHYFIVLDTISAED